MIRATENWVISDRFLHRFAFGYNRFGNANRSVYFNAGWPSKIGLVNQPDTTFPRFAFTGAAAILGTLGNYGSLNRNETYEGSTIIQDDLTIIMGKHNIKTGFEGRFYYSKATGPTGPRLQLQPAQRTCRRDRRPGMPRELRWRVALLTARTDRQQFIYQKKTNSTCRTTPR